VATSPPTGSGALSRPVSVVRATRRSFVATLLAIGLVASATTPAIAASASSTSQSIDAIAQQYFDAQTSLRDLDARVTSLERRIGVAEHEAATARRVATARAVELYKGSALPFVAVLQGSDALDSARRVQLISRANQRSTAAFDRLSALTNDLREQRKAVVTARAEQSRVVAALAARRRSLESRLRAEQAAAARRATNRLDRARTAAAPSGGASSASRTATTAAPASPAPPSSADPTTADPTTAAATTAAPPVTTPSPSNGFGSHHDDPFLTCTRARESGGNYQVVSSAGYYGAYQFSQLTWDVTASHAGRPDLIGVRPSQASPADQDLLAWTLYQWQGTAPWGGRC